MKKLLLGLGLAGILLGTSAYISLHTSGIAGYTASPGEASCTTCHGGGPVPASAAITISATPSFSNNKYSPNQTYTIAVDLSAAGYPKFGIDCEILDSAGMNSGTLQATTVDLQLMNAGGRTNVTHTGGKNGNGAVTFAFEWTAPPSGLGTATIYVAGNAVNGNHSTSGDYPIPPVSLDLEEGDPVTPPPVLTSLRKGIAASISQVSTYPNPIPGDYLYQSYVLAGHERVTIELTDVHGKAVKQFIQDESQAPGRHKQLLSLYGVSPGIYFIKTLLKGQQAAQKMVVLH